MTMNSSSLNRRLWMPSTSHVMRAISHGTMMNRTIKTGMKIIIALLLTTLPAAAQQLYFPWQPATATQSSGTITSGGTFQTILASNLNRKGCLIQNTSGHTMDIYVGALGSATTANSVQVAASGGVFYCNLGPIVLTGDVNATTTTTNDTFIVLSAQ